MKIAIIGYGKMGRMIEAAATRHQVEVVCVLDPLAGNRGQLAEADVCIEFTQPDAVLDNIKLAASAGKPIVVGTTGWYEHLDEVRTLVEATHIGFVYGTNFSIGVNLMFKVVEYAASLFKNFSSYEPFLEEAHHKFKKDAPSGTALALQQRLDSQYHQAVPTSSTRAGFIPGIHTVGFDSEVDTLTITHTARSRAGFADGALVAAKWILDKKGFFEFSQIV
ncbi:MAG: dihydrodipicolinate reductase [Acidobacteria bacterium]|nr:dihydrodipicolinate reductase [Acidobacteriota bacterium]